MKIALECQSLLLQDSLRYYLSNHLCDIADCDFIVSDYPLKSQKPVYQVNIDSNTLPFIPSELLEDLQRFSDSLTQHLEQDPCDDELKAEIQSLLMEFADRFLQIIKKYH